LGYLVCSLQKRNPFLKELEKEMHDKDVTFVSLSVDEKKNEQKWHDMVKEMELSGVQLFAGSFENKVTDLYEITSIPRLCCLTATGRSLP
jgi:alkyl hydroperoxide reductase subunit AhpC